MGFVDFCWQKCQKSRKTGHFYIIGLIIGELVKVACFCTFLTFLPTKVHKTIDHCSSGRPSAANFWFLTAIEVHCFYSWLGKKFDLGLFSCKTWVPNRSFKIGFINLSQFLCLWQWFEIEFGQKSQNSDLQFSWILEFCKKHPIFKMQQIPKYPTNFQI